MSAARLFFLLHHATRRPAGLPFRQIINGRPFASLLLSRYCRPVWRTAKRGTWLSFARAAEFIMQAYTNARRWHALAVSFTSARSFAIIASAIAPLAAGRYSRHLDVEMLSNPSCCVASIVRAVVQRRMSSKLSLDDVGTTTSNVSPATRAVLPKPTTPGAIRGRIRRPSACSIANTSPSVPATAYSAVIDRSWCLRLHEERTGASRAPSENPPGEAFSPRPRRELFFLAIKKENGLVRPTDRSFPPTGQGWRETRVSPPIRSAKIKRPGSAAGPNLDFAFALSSGGPLRSVRNDPTPARAKSVIGSFPFLPCVWHR